MMHAVFMNRSTSISIKYCKFHELNSDIIYRILTCFIQSNDEDDDVKNINIQINFTFKMQFKF